MRLLAAAFALALAAATGCERLVDARIEQGLGRVDESILGSPDLHVVLCGTGTPLPDAERAGACTAIAAGGRLFLVDVGPGSREQVDLANLPIAALAGVFLTHFHSDHLGDLGEAATQSWIAGRARPLAVYGPPGTARVVAGVARLVLTHLVPGPPNALARRIFLEGVSEAFDGEVVLGRDGMRFVLPAAGARPAAPGGP
jgi:ribonuclease Z